jgi:hypothetical protein
MFENESEFEAHDYEDIEFEVGNREEAAEEIDLLVRCVHAARLAGA